MNFFNPAPKPGTAFVFNYASIEQHVPERSIGAYLLGKIFYEDFIAMLNGRSDYDLRSELKKKLITNFSYFKINICKTIQECYERDCRNYHYFINNPDLPHPYIPERMMIPCPVCNCTFIDPNYIDWNDYITDDLRYENLSEHFTTF